jgi:glyoxylase-like metal-dependent hydrolase (beta-lactamase superfamily II)
MMQSRMIGDVKVSRILEYAAPTHDPAFLFPELDRSRLEAHRSWLAPHHWVEGMNRLIITIQLWVVQAGGHVIVVDTGVGNRKPRAADRMNGLNGLMIPWLTAVGAAPEKVTHVVHTHLHSDHVGWNTMLKEGRWEPTFPNARYLMPRTDFEHYKSILQKAPDPIIDASFQDSVLPLVDAGLVDFIEPGDEVVDLLRVEAAPGHSVGQVNFRIRSRGEEGLFSGDVMHSPIQIVEPWLNTTYCALPEVARKTRATFLDREAEREALIMPMHFGTPHCGFIRREDGGFRFEPASWDNDFR